MHQMHKALIIRKMDTSHLGAVVAIHKEAFKGFFLTRMGPHFLLAYYQTVLDFEASISLVAQDPESDRTLGFAVGFRDPKGFYALFAKRRKRMLPVVLLAALRDPGLVPQILRNMRRVDAQAQHAVNAVELSSIAAGAPGRGVGSALLEAFADNARSEGGRTLILTTDADGNHPVRKFYESRGFTLDGYEHRGERRMSRYVRSLGHLT